MIAFFRAIVNAKRRSHVTGIFPNEASLLRLIGSVLIGYNEKVQASTYTVFSKTGCCELCRNMERQIKMAGEQRKLLTA